MNRNKKGAHLKELKLTESLRTHSALGEALKRFKSGKLSNLPAGSPLTRLNLSLEAAVSRDTPFARYRSGTDKIGEFRYPDIVDEFNLLRKSLKGDKNVRSDKQIIRELKKEIRNLYSLLSKSREVVNVQDILIRDLNEQVISQREDLERQNKKISDIEKEAAELKRSGMRIIPMIG